MEEEKKFEFRECECLQNSGISVDGEIFVLACRRVDDVLYFFDNYSGLLCQLDPETSEIKILKDFLISEGILYITFYDEKWYLVSHRGVRMWIYDIKEDCVEDIVFEHEFYQNQENVNGKCIRKGRYIYIMPMTLVCENNNLIIVAFSIEEKRFQLVRLEPNSTFYTENTCTVPYSIRGTDGGIYGVSDENGGIIRIDIDNLTYNLVQIDLKREVLSAYYDGNGYLLQGKKGLFVTYMDSHGNEVWHIESADEGIEWEYNFLLDNEKYVVALPCQGEFVAIINKETHKFQKFQIERKAGIKGSACYCWNESDGCLIIFPNSMKGFYKINLSDESITKLKPWMYGNEWIKRFNKNTDNMYGETKEFGMEKYLNLVLYQQNR